MPDHLFLLSPECRVESREGLGVDRITLVEYFGTKKCAGTRVRLPSKPAHEPSNGPKLPVSDVCAVVL